MDDDDYEDDYEDVGYGLYNHLWMLKSSLYHVPHTYLYHGVCALVDYLTQTEEPEVAQALDVLAQSALTGHYHNPFEDEPEEVHRLTEEEIEEEINQFRRVLRGIPVRNNIKTDDTKEGDNAD